MFDGGISESFDFVVPRVEAVRSCQITKILDVEKGVESHKWFVKVSVDDRFNSIMFVRDFEGSHRGSGKNKADVYMKRYKSFKGVGLPVANTVRQSVDGQKILMSDVTENGKYLVVDPTHNPENGVKITNWGEVVMALDVVRTKAVDLGYFIRNNGYCLLVDRNTGEAKVSLLDLNDGVMEIDSVRRGFERSKIAGSNFDDYLKNTSLQSAEMFIEMVKICGY